MADPTVTRILEEVRAGDPGAADRLLPLVYERLRGLAAGYLRRERPDHTLQATALVHEAYLKLVDQRRADWKDRAHFLAVGALAMKRILVDHARGKKREKRGGGRERVTLDGISERAADDEVDLVVLADALETLAALDPDQARVVELRFLGGLTVEETSQALGVSRRTVEREWTHARAWLRRELGE